MFWNPVASLSPISSPPSHLSPSLHLSAPLLPPPAERTVCGAHRQKKARQAQDLTERIQRPPGPVEQQHEHTLPLESRESTRIGMHWNTQTDIFKKKKIYSHTISSSLMWLNKKGTEQRQNKKRALKVPYDWPPYKTQYIDFKSVKPVIPSHSVVNFWMISNKMFAFCTFDSISWCPQMKGRWQKLTKSGWSKSKKLRRNKTNRLKLREHGQVC